MKILADQDVYQLTIRFLVDTGYDYDVVRVAEIGMATSKDEENLVKASELDRVFLTRDRDYGNLVFVRSIRVGVIYLRMLPSNREQVHKELERVLGMYSESELRRSFVVVEAGRHRFRKIEST